MLHLQHFSNTDKNMIKSKPTSIRLGERALFAKEKLKIESAQKLFDYFIDNFWFSHNPIPLGETIKVSHTPKDGFDGAKVKLSQLDEPTLMSDSKVHVPIKKEVSKVSLDNPYGFGNEQYLVIEDYTKFPLSKAPIKGWERAEYLNNKKVSDSEIRTAFNNFKNK